MSALPVSAPSTGNPILDAIDTATQWSGVITYNRVDPMSPAETGAFAGALPSPYQTAGLGLTNGIWTVVEHALSVLRGYAAVSYVIDDSPDANYFASDFTNPNNRDNAGIAAPPGSTPVLAFNRNTWGFYSDQQQTYIVMHELLHTLGERHPVDLPAALARAQYTMMSYDWYTLGDQDLGEGLPLTPMALDIALLQARYGAAVANITDTRYVLSRFLPDTDGADGLVTNGRGYICIWDTGGVDTLAYGGATSALINLNAATLTPNVRSADLADVIGDVAAASRLYSALGMRTQAEIADPVASAGGFFSSLLSGGEREVGGFTIANGARIENATGGGGADLLIGNELANTLRGGAGADELFGGSGDDGLDGEAGDDRAFGGLGADTIVDAGGSNYLRGDEGDDSIVGGAGFDDINGNVGSDTASGGLGEDWVVGGKDNDSLSGGEAYDLVYGNLGNDTCDGGAGNDIVRGGQQDDRLFGGDGDDYMSGDKDNDTLTGGAGADIFHSFGDAGLDRVTDFNRAEGDRVLLDAGTTYSVADSGGDVVISMTGGAQMILVGVSMSSLTGNWITVG